MNAPAPRWRLHPEDSEVRAVEHGHATDGPWLALRLSAAAVSPAGASGPPQGWLGAVTLRLEGAQWQASEALGGLFGPIRQASLQGPAGPLATLPLPAEAEGPWRLTLWLPHDQTLALQARRLVTRLDGPAEPHPDLRC